MKPNIEMLFGNFYNDHKIAPTYLERHADDVIAKLTKGNTGGMFDTVLNPLKAAMIPFKAELSEVDTSVNILLGKTQTVDEFIAVFKVYMRDSYINIAAKLGGEKTAEFLEFYPGGRTEYSTITKTKMPTIVARLNTAATNNATALGATITTQLQAFKIQWDNVRDKQLEGKATLKTNRTERSTVRVTVENCLIAVVRFVANKYPGNVEKCSMYFNFSLLFGVHHSSDKEPETPVNP